MLLDVERGEAGRGQPTWGSRGPEDGVRGLEDGVTAGNLGFTPIGASVQGRGARLSSEARAGNFGCLTVIQGCPETSCNLGCLTVQRL